MTRREKTPLELTAEVLDISASERATFKKCRRKWELEVLDNLAPKTPPTFDLEFGSGIHRALEAYYTGKVNQPMLPPGKKTKSLPLRSALGEWDIWYTETETRVIMDKSLESTTKDLALDELVELADLGEEMIRGYHQFAKTEDDFTVHAIEGKLTPAGESWLRKHWEDREFAGEIASNGVKHQQETSRLLIPILNPKTQKPIVKNGPVLSMRMDMLVHRIDVGMKGWWVYDHKSWGRQPNDRGLDFEDQVTSYLYGVWRWLGIIPRGMCFNYLIKKVPREPRILQHDKLSTAKDQLTRADWYKEELIERGLMLKDGTIHDQKYAEAYEALLSHGWDRFFIRHYVTRNRNELISFEERLADEWEEMDACWNGDMALYPNMSTMWCPSCSVNSICQAIEDGSDWEAVIENRYVEKPDRKAERFEDV